MQRRDAFAIEAENHQVIVVFGLPQPSAIELIKVSSSANGQLFRLTLRDLGAALLPHQLDHLVKRGTSCLLGNDAPHLVRVLLLGQLHRSVERRERIGIRSSSRASRRRRYPLPIDPDRSIATNLLESITFPRLQKSRTLS